MSKLILGMMRISEMSKEAVLDLIKNSLALGIKVFDHADIYGGGKSEEVFGEALKLEPSLRDKMFIQSKVGICRGYYDSSYQHIVNSTLAILKRLKIDYLDRLLIHRPDFLADLDEVKKAFTYLYKNGLVRSFGVSNMSPLQIELLEKKTGFKITVNQLQFSIVHSQMVKNAIGFNMTGTSAYDTTKDIVAYSLLNDFKIQTWSPLMASWEDGCFIDNPKYPELNDYLALLASKYQVTKNAIAVAWILRAGENFEVVLGSTKPSRIKEMVKAQDIILEREEWYQLFLKAGNILP